MSFISSSAIRQLARTPRSLTLRVRQLVVLATATVIALLLGASTASAVSAGHPTADPFYKAPDNLASIPNGDPIRSRITSMRLSPYIKMPFKVHQVAYRTTDRRDQPIVGIATIIKPLQNAPKTGNRLLSYQTAYDGLGPACRPSYSLQSGKVALQGAEQLLMLNLLRRGWTVVTTDYEGPSDNWGVAVTTARGVLDGIRAAERHKPAGLDEGVNTKVGMMGYSGGGNATAWANEHAPGYAPELNIVGAAQGGVAGDLGTMVKSLDGELYAGIAFAGLVGVTSGYPEVDLASHMNNRGKKMLADFKSWRNHCISDFFLDYPFKKLSSMLTTKNLLDTPKFQEINAENKLGRFAPKAPTLWYHTYFDEMGSWYVNKQVARWYCTQGTPVEFRTSYVEEHALQAVLRPWEAQDWIAKRFNDGPLKPTCPNPQ